MLQRVLATIRYFRDVGDFLREAITVEEARRIVDKQLSAREQEFLHIMEHVVYADPANPYHRLLRQAGFTLAQVRRLVEESGLEGALERLHDAGIYVSQDEFKGRTSIKRDGLEFSVRASDFDNPLPRKTVDTGHTSGSTGTPMQINRSLERVGYTAAESFFLDSLQVGTRPIGVWQPSGIHTLLLYAKTDRIPEKLFTTVGFRRSWEGVREAIRIQLTLLAARLAGRRLPNPQFVPSDSAVTIAKWLAQKTAAGTPAFFRAHASQALQICLAARDHAIDIRGTLFQMGGEPYTTTRAELLASVGAGAIVRYVSRETSLVGISCHTPAEVDDVHLLLTKTAMITRPRKVLGDETVNALIFTNVLASSPKIAINLYSGDYATVAERDCGCPLAKMGFNTHLSNIRSYEKLTSGGVTFIGSKLYDLVEQVLPAWFGGHLNDYQLVEEEAADGLPQVKIIVAPGVGIIDEAAVIEAVLKGLEQRHAGAGGELMATQWRQWRTLTVVRREPYHTPNGKVPPLYFLKPDASRSGREEVDLVATS
jgi:hypothetical protein